MHQSAGLLSIRKQPLRPASGTALATALVTLACQSAASTAVAGLAVATAPAPGIEVPALRPVETIDDRRRDGTPMPVRIAQNAPAAGAASRTKQLKGKPGDSLPLVHELADMAVSTGNYVIVKRTPAWLSLSPAEPIGSGSWLLNPEQLKQARLSLSRAAKGQHEIAIAVVGPGGSPIAEAKILIDATGEASVVAAASPVTVASVSKSTAGAEGPPPGPAPAPVPVARPAAPAPAAAPTAVAQVTTTPAKDGTKAWTDFLGGARQGGQAGAPAAKPAARPGDGAKPEADLIGYAKHLVRECTTCHSLYGQDVGIPLMIGLTKDRFLDTMELYRAGKRDNVAMQSVAKSLNEEETLALALYLGRIKPPAQSAPAASRSALGNAAAAAPAAVAGLSVPAQPLAAGSKDLERVERWLKRGKQMLDQGEISQARLLLTRATELGDPRAALLLASSYDPNALPWRSGMGMEAEPARAKELYQLAIRLGAGAEAEKRLSELP